MERIVVETQVEFDNIPLTFNGVIEIHNLRSDGRIFVTPRGNTQIVKCSEGANLTISGNARIVTLPDTAEEYADFYGLSVNDGCIIGYKSIATNGLNFYNGSFCYEVGKTYKAECDFDRSVQCGAGLHVSHLDWAIQFGRQHDHFKVIECSVPMDKVVVPKYTDGKVRTSELTVIREVPMDEWGIYGKMMAKQK